VRKQCRLLAEKRRASKPNEKVRVKGIGMIAKEKKREVRVNACKCM
jgi:hypothetical protein